MTTRKATKHRRATPACLVFVVLLSTPGIGRAGQFSLFKGKVLGVTKTTITIGGAWRNADPHMQLVGAGAGQGENPEFPGASGAVGVNDDGNLNFGKYDLVSNPMTLVSEMTFRHSSGQGIFLRLRAWNDIMLESRTMPHGSGPTRYVQNVQLDDTNYLGAAQFHGIDIYDAFFFGHYKLGQTHLDLRLGRQALQWGESILYPGLNALNPYDVAWLTITGAPVLNGGRLPVNRVYLNVAPPGGWTIDGFFNLEFRSTVLPGCGTYFSTLDNGMHPGCNVATALGVPDVTANIIRTRNFYNGRLYAGGVFPEGGPDALDASMAPSRWSGYGISAHKFVESLDTNFGFYYASYTNPTPVAAPVVGTDPLDFAMNTMFVEEDVKVLGVSAATGARNLALYGQLTYSMDLPSQRNAPAFIEGSLSGTGPYGWMQEYVNKEAPGYYPLDVAQLQLGGTWQFGEHVHLSDAKLTFETNLQYATNHPGLQGPNAERLGRYGNFGTADWNQQGYICDPGPLDNGVVNRCEVDGFVTDFSVGYKLRAQATIPKVGPGLTFIPILVFNHDPYGFSPDGAILEGRLSLSTFLRVLLRQKYFVEAGLVMYNRGADWDPLADRGQYSLVFGINL